MDIEFNKGDLFGATVPLEVTAKGVTIHGKKLPGEAVAYLVAYGLKQSLADSYAAAKTPKEIADAFHARLTKIIDGEMTIGAGGGRALSPVEKTARNMADIFARSKGMKPKAAADWAKANWEKFRDAAQTQLAAMEELTIDI